MFNSNNVEDRVAAITATYNATLQKNHAAVKAVEETNKTLEILKFQMEALRNLELETKEEQAQDDNN